MSGFSVFLTSSQSPVTFRVTFVITAYWETRWISLNRWHQVFLDFIEAEPKLAWISTSEMKDFKHTKTQISLFCLHVSSFITWSEIKQKKQTFQTLKHFNWLDVRQRERDFFQQIELKVLIGQAEFSWLPCLQRFLGKYSPLCLK